MISEVMDQDFLLAVERIDGKSPHLDISIQQASDCVLVVVAEVDSGDGHFFLGYVGNLRPDCQFLKGVEVDVLQRPNIQQVLRYHVPITLVPLQFVLSLNSEMSLPLYAELHARQKLGPLHVADHIHLHQLDLFSPN